MYICAYGLAAGDAYSAKSLLNCKRFIFLRCAHNICDIFSKPIDKIWKWVYYLAIESKQINERSGMQCLKSILMQHSLVVECVSPGHIRMAGCIRIRFAAPETWFFRRDIITPFARELFKAPAFFVLGFPEPMKFIEKREIIHEKPD